MTDSTTSITPWNPADQVIIPAKISSASDLVQYADASLSNRDKKAIVAGFVSESYEMVATFVWAKAAATLKRQIATLGMEFVGEMLGRPDLDDGSDSSTAIGDYEAIGLAEDLGMVTTTQGLRLKHSLELVSHFSNLDHTPEEEDADGMEQLEALGLLRTCITSILGKPRFDAALKFADFREQLSNRTFKADDSDVLALKSSPYFFIRTTLSVLLATSKTAKSAALEHATGNIMVLIPIIWNTLKSPERWQVGQAYAEVTSNGNRIASAGLKKTLLAVKGFDYVPESLRSSSFTEVAARVLAAHFALNNFYKEEEPMNALESLGSSIPMPAFAKCMEAILAVRLGNGWGHAWSAQPAAEAMLKSLSDSQWEYYFNECFPRDKTVLDKLSQADNTIARWREVVLEYKPDGFKAKNNNVHVLLKECEESESPASNKRIKVKAHLLRMQVGK